MDAKLTLMKSSPSGRPTENGTTRPRLCFIGPMIGRNPGHITHPGELLSDLFADAGYPVISASATLNRFARLGDICSTLVRHRHDVDIIVLQVYAERSFVIEDIASWLGRRFGRRIVMALHGGTIPRFIERFPSWSRRVLGRAHVVVTPSEYLARVVRRRGFEPRVIPNLLDLSFYTFRPRRALAPRLFWMRSFYDYYNPAMAVRALARLRNWYPDASLVMAGRDKGIEAQIKHMVRERGLADCVRFPGFLDMDGKVREGDAADIYLNTTNIDNMPVGVLESFAMGMPVVATRVGGIEDMLTDGQDALLVPDDDDEAMANAIRRLIEDPDLAARLSTNGRRLAEAVSWEAVRPQWESVFAEVMAQRS
jgi:glycosyltransferase involved in cell wall biosynthesis